MSAKIRANKNVLKMTALIKLSINCQMEPEVKSEALKAGSKISWVGERANASVGSG